MSSNPSSSTGGVTPTSGGVGGGTSGSTSSGGGGGGGSGGGGGGPCGACKFLRRKCVAGCIFAPYFDSEQGAAHFAAVHKVFGASNVSKLLLHIPVHKRLDAVVTICYEAQARLRDPVYGCVAHIFALQQQMPRRCHAKLHFLYLHMHLNCRPHICTSETQVKRRCRDKGKAPAKENSFQEATLYENIRIDQFRFGLEGMESYYLLFKEARDY
ncbi:hypothetical protein HAX54_006596 [Datura stramonium]|uniref:LOB domain-containing protein n=1 Tax=Datura stramonium TaxID=4076 RepID=A0ABS8TAJ6_DATST|nr:hypothetical protein [Datura stramonium]